MAVRHPIAEAGKPHRWRKGESGNPKGYSRKRRLIDAFLAYLDETNAHQRVLEAWLQGIVSGDYRYLKELLDRHDGPVDSGHGSRAGVDEDVQALRDALRPRIIIPGSPLDEGKPKRRKPKRKAPGRTTSDDQQGGR
jgi:hypothetical protein